jgi:hypothetical protein
LALRKIQFGINFESTQAREYNPSKEEEEEEEEGASNGASPLHKGQHSLVLPLNSLFDMSSMRTAQSCFESNAYPAHRPFYRKLNLCYAVFGLFCVINNFN